MPTNKTKGVVHHVANDHHCPHHSLSPRVLKLAFTSCAETLQQILARTAVLGIGVAIAFCVAQAAAVAGFLSLTLAYTPLDILSLLSVLYWLSFFTTGSTYAAAKDMRL